MRRCELAPAEWLDGVNVQSGRMNQRYTASLTGNRSHLTLHLYANYDFERRSGSGGCM